MTHEQIIGTLENILFAAGDSMALSELADILDISQEELEAMLEEEGRRREGAFGLVFRRLEDRVQLATRTEHARLLVDLFGSKSGEELTKAMLETLSIIAYKQPVTRGEIEDLSGVNTSHILSALQEKGLVVEAGRKEALGRPILYATSEEFLRHFGISSTKELPALPEQ